MPLPNTVQFTTEVLQYSIIVIYLIITVCHTVYCFAWMILDTLPGWDHSHTHSMLCVYIYLNHLVFFYPVHYSVKLNSLFSQTELFLYSQAELWKIIPADCIVINWTHYSLFVTLTACDSSVVQSLSLQTVLWSIEPMISYLLR